MWGSIFVFCDLPPRLRILKRLVQVTLADYSTLEPAQNLSAESEVL